MEPADIERFSSRVRTSTPRVVHTPSILTSRSGCVNGSARSSTLSTPSREILVYRFEKSALEPFTAEDHSRFDVC